jgi:hypothetical protein
MRRGTGVVNVKSPKQKRNKSATKVLTKEMELEILLFRTERSWAYAMALRKEAITEPRKVYHERKRWRKACEDSCKLVGQLESIDAKQEFIEEAKAYAHWIKANELFSRLDWTGAFYEFNKCLKGLSTFTNRSGPESAFISSRKLEADSLARYCRHMSIEDINDAQLPDLNVEERQVSVSSGSLVRIRDLDWSVPESDHQFVQAAIQSPNKIGEIRTCPETVSFYCFAHFIDWD